jgi:hypothetical protein
VGGRKTEAAFRKRRLDTTERRSGVMDPNEALKRAREAIERYQDDASLGFNTDTRLEAADKLADAFEALDEWLSKGGFLPLEWSESLRKQRTCDVTACQSRATRAVFVCEKHFTERNPR